ncbi:MurR/RpiR family transcriptional regulator [Lactococcus garvieae]|uniref:MurR/RpiR family transcriptional regulator n=1 Tax=Lactococcus garvieae TaxID=1363 RepID=UPI0038538FE7
MTMGILLNNYQHQLKSLTASELSAFTLMDNQPELILSMNLTSLAQKLCSSNSTLIRLCQKLGFAGFSDFKSEVKRIIEQTKYLSHSSLFESYRFFFNEILPNINRDKLEYFAEKINLSNNIFIIGLGLTKPIAEYISKRLYQLDRASTYVSESHMLDLLPNLARRGDLIIFISESGETKSLLNCAQKVGQTGAVLLSITNSQHNTLNHSMHMSLTSQMPENHFHNYDITSRVFQMALLDLILDIYLNKYLKDLS